MLSVKDAQSKIAKLLTPVGSETVGISDVGGRVLVAPAVALRDQPPFAASAMDGYAILKSDLNARATLSVIGEISAGNFNPLSVASGQAVRIFTGAPLPEHADHILIQEDAERTGDTITIKEGFESQSYVRPAGGDFKKGFELSAPRRLSASDVALLASMNVPKIRVSRRPVVSIIPTGDELVWPGDTPAPDQIIASNNFGLKAMLEAEGADVRLLPIAPDTTTGLTQLFDLTEGSDLIITLGGASVGDHDLVQSVAKAEGLDLSFYKLAMRPGKPLMAGLLRGIPMIGLPGNPVSSMVCAQIFIKPAIRALCGLGYQSDPIYQAKLDTDIGPNGPREHYMRARVKAGPDGWICSPFERQDSSLLSILSDANALMIRPAHDPAQTAGAVVDFTHIERFHMV